MRYLSFCHDVCGHAQKGFDKKAKVNFRIYDVTDWITNHYYTYCTISQEVKATRQWGMVSR